MTQPQAAIYARDQYANIPFKDEDGNWPEKLQGLLDQAAKVPRPFETVIVATPAVLGRPEEAQEVVDHLAQFGITIQAADEQAVGTKKQAKS